MRFLCCTVLPIQMPQALLRPCGEGHLPAAASRDRGQSRFRKTRDLASSRGIPSTPVANPHGLQQAYTHDYLFMIVNSLVSIFAHSFQNNAARSPLLFQHSSCIILKPPFSLYSSFAKESSNAQILETGHVTVACHFCLGNRGSSVSALVLFSFWQGLLFV